MDVKVGEHASKRSKYDDQAGHELQRTEYTVAKRLELSNDQNLTESRKEPSPQAESTTLPVAASALTKPE